MKKTIFAGVDIGGTKIAAGLVAPTGRILCRAKTQTPQDASAGKIIRLIDKLIDDICEERGLKLKNLAGIGVGVPGLVDAQGKIVQTPNMNLSGVPFKKLLEINFKTKIALGNDVNCGMLGEKWRGAARGAKNIIGIFCGTGVGGGIIVNNQCITGLHGAAGEIGHMTLEANGPKCHCGNSGCLESYVGRWAIERDIKKAIAAGEKTVVTKLMDGKIKTIKSKILAKALRKRDLMVTKILTQAALRLGHACISLRHIFDPEIILLGGGVIEACGAFMLPIVKKTVAKDKLFSKIDACNIMGSQLGDDAIIFGGVALVSGKS